jgi:hypothetical protein
MSCLLPSKVVTKIQIQNELILNDEKAADS